LGNNRGGVVLGVLVPLVRGQAGERVGNVDGLPSVLGEQWVVGHESGNGLVHEFVLEDDETGGLVRLGEPDGELVFDAGLGEVGVGADLPVIAVLVPYNGGQAEDVPSDSTDSVIGVTIRRPEVLGNTSAGGVGNNLHGPT